MILLATLSLMMLFSGCGKTTTAEQKSTSAENTGVIGASLELITDWETRAEITLDTQVDINGTGVKYQDGTILITEGGQYLFSGKAKQLQVIVDTDEDVKLSLQGVEMTNETGPVIYGKNANSLYIEASDGTDNTLTDGSNYEADEDGETGKGTIFSNDTIVLCGSGTLTIEGNAKHGICSDDDLYVEGIALEIRANVKDGLHANDGIYIDSGTLRITAASDCIESEGVLVINGGVIEGESADEGIESKDVLTVNGGMITLKVTDDGLNAANAIVFHDGECRIYSTAGDAIDSNGSLTIHGGTIYAYGGSAPEGALDCDETEIVINGGTVVAVGDSNSTISEESEQISVLLSGYTKGSVVAIQEEGGKEIFSFTLEDSKSNLILSLPDLKQGKTYEVLVDGETVQNFTADSQVISAGGSTSSPGGMGGNGVMGTMPGNRNGRPDDIGNMPDGNVPDGQKMPDGNMPGKMFGGQRMQ